MVEFFEDDNTFYLVFELIRGGKLLSVVFRSRGATESHPVKALDWWILKHHEALGSARFVKIFMIFQKSSRRISEIFKNLQVVSKRFELENFKNFQTQSYLNFLMIWLYQHDSIWVIMSHYNELFRIIGEPHRISCFKNNIWEWSEIACSLNCTCS